MAYDFAAFYQNLGVKYFAQARQTEDSMRRDKLLSAAELSLEMGLDAGLTQNISHPRYAQLLYNLCVVKVYKSRDSDTLHIVRDLLERAQKLTDSSRSKQNHLCDQIRHLQNRVFKKLGKEALGLLS